MTRVKRPLPERFTHHPHIRGVYTEVVDPICGLSALTYKIWRYSPILAAMASRSLGFRFRGRPFWRGCAGAAATAAAAAAADEPLKNTGADGSCGGRDDGGGGYDAWTTVAAAAKADGMALCRDDDAGDRDSGEADDEDADDADDADDGDDNDDDIKGGGGGGGGHDDGPPY